MTPPTPENLRSELNELQKLKDDPDRLAAELLRLRRTHRAHAAELDAWAATMGRATNPPTIQGKIRIGSYTLHRPLGQGAFGEVWLAEQDTPRRRVAIKRMKPGLDGDEFLGRFEQEKQALAAMEHPAIAAIIDAGITGEGGPWFAMEYVENGLPVTDYCDRHQLTIRERIALFLQICAGVQHAHHKGVVHRDLKPGNILATRTDGRDSVKIIDFGIARAMSHGSGTPIASMDPGQVVGTYEYMAPEQADPTGTVIDQRVDVYALGVVLYELLSGTQPFPAATLRRQSLVRIVETIKTVEPERPSTCFAIRVGGRGPGLVGHDTPSPASDDTRTGQVTSIARMRRTTPAALARQLRGDIDAIVLQAMAKDPALRYSSANELALDLQRYLALEPVVARAPTWRYRATKIVRKHRWQVGSVTAAVLALIGGTIGTGIGLARAKENARIANQIADANRSLAANERQAREAATKSLDDFHLLANILELQAAARREADLYPPFPEQIPAMQAWLAQYAPLTHRLPVVNVALQTLEERALPIAAAQRLAALQANPRHAAWSRLQRELAAALAADRVRHGGAVATFALPEATRTATAAQLNESALAMVDPDERQPGGESEALALARLALAKVDAGDPSVQRWEVLDTLAWACTYAGLDDEAMIHSRAIAACRLDEDARLHVSAHNRRREEEIAAWRGAEDSRPLAQLRLQLAELEAELTATCERQFAEAGDRFLYLTLRNLRSDLQQFVSDHGLYAAVQARLDSASTIRSLTIDAFKVEWDNAGRAIAQSPHYGGLKLTPQLGLVPLGPDPQSGLWEFAHLGSGARGREVLQRDSHGRLAANGDCGLVLVLLPAAKGAIGAPVEDAADSPAGAASALPPLAPFFLSKYEMTQGQWARLWYGPESRRHPSFFQPGKTYDGVQQPITSAHPVENVTWEECNRVMRHHGLALPTEAQWEYAARAGANTAWYTGSRPESLEGHANLLDLAASRQNKSWFGGVSFDDGYVATAPVGHYLANAFGLHDVHGNVREWCMDWYGSYRLATESGTGLRLMTEATDRRVVRGGSFLDTADETALSWRGWNAPTGRHAHIGVRPARQLLP